MSGAAWDPSLEPVRRALLDAAEQDADRAVALAEHEAAETLRRAASEEQKVRDDARARGERDGSLEVADQQRRALIEARRVVLSAQRDAYVNLRDEVRARLAAFAQDPSYSALRERLVAKAFGTLGPEAAVTEVPDGGIVATVGKRSLNLTLPVLADLVLESLGSQLEDLWVP